MQTLETAIRRALRYFKNVRETGGGYRSSLSSRQKQVGSLGISRVLICGLLIQLGERKLLAYSCIHTHTSYHPVLILVLFLPVMLRPRTAMACFLKEGGFCPCFCRKFCHPPRYQTRKLEPMCGYLFAMSLRNPANGGAVSQLPPRQIL